MQKLWAFILCAVLVAAPRLVLAQDCQALFESRADRLNTRLPVVSENAVDTWIAAHFVKFETLLAEERSYIRKTLQNPKLFAYAQRLKGRVGIVKEINNVFAQGADAVHYEPGARLISHRPWLGYRVDLVSDLPRPGSTFVHELAHWMTSDLGIYKQVDQLLAERKRKMRLDGFKYDSYPRSPFITVGDGTYRLVLLDMQLRPPRSDYDPRRLFDREETKRFRYFVSTSEYIAYAIQAYFLERGSEFLISGEALLSYDLLKKNDPEMFKIIDDLFRNDDHL